MCYDRRSFASDSRKAADMEQSKRKETKRTETRGFGNRAEAQEIITASRARVR